MRRGERLGVDRRLVRAAVATREVELDLVDHLLRQVGVVRHLFDLQLHLHTTIFAYRACDVVWFDTPCMNS